MSDFKEKEREKEGFNPYNVLFGKTKDKAKITNLWILSFHTQNNIYDYVWNELIHHLRFEYKIEKFASILKVQRYIFFRNSGLLEKIYIWS